MKTDKLVLVVDRPNGMLSEVMDELDQLGFRVVWVPTLSVALEFLSSAPRLSLLIASAAAGEEDAENFLVQVRQLAPEVRVILGVNESQGRSAQTRRGAPSPDSLIPEPVRLPDLQAAVSQLLAAHFYPPPIAEAVKTAALEVLRTWGEFQLEGNSFLVGNQTALYELSAVIPFGGDVTGHLMVGMAREHAQNLHHRIASGGPPARLDELEDLVGELCNQVLGRINVFLGAFGVNVQHTTPIFVRAPGSTLRYPGRQPSFGVQLSSPGASVALEYYLADLDQGKLRNRISNRTIKLGEVRYL